jgi:hypothetical protein
MKSILLSNQVGSVLWRLLNYGAFATFQYIFFEKFRQSTRSIHDPSKIISEIDLAVTLELNQEIMLIVQNFYDKFIIACEERFANRKIKTGSISYNLSKNRLYCIGLALCKFRPNLYVETGTQHGISAEFAVQFSKAIDLDLTVVSFDVNSDSFIIPNYNFKQIMLQKPVRKNFSRHLNKLRGNYNKIIFFHDSDHSYENMFSEFNTAWKILKPIAILSDDVNLNKSFSNFCCSKDLEFIEFSLGHGNSVGLSKK